MVQLQLRCGYLWCFALLRSHMALPCTHALGVTIRYAGSNIFFMFIAVMVPTWELLSAIAVWDSG